MSNVTIAEIARITARTFGLPEDALTSPAVRIRAGQKRRGTPMSLALNTAALLAQRHTASGMHTIGRELGRRDAPALVVGAARIDEERHHDADLAARIERIEAAIDAVHEARLDEAEAVAAAHEAAAENRRRRLAGVLDAGIPRTVEGIP